MPKALKVLIVLVLCLAGVSFMYSKSHKQLRDEVTNQATQIKDSTSEAMKKVPSGNDVEVDISKKIEQHNKYVEEHKAEIHDKEQKDTDTWMTPHRPNN